MCMCAGKATCDACRPKKRKQCAGAAIDKKQAMDHLENEHKRMQGLVTKQDNDLSFLRNQVSMVARTLLQQRTTKTAPVSAVCALTPQPAHQTAQSCLYSQVAPPILQQTNIQQPFVDAFSMTQPPAVLPMQHQQVIDANQTPVRNAFAGDQAYESFPVKREPLQQQQQQLHGQELLHSQLLLGSHAQPLVALGMLPQMNMPMMNTFFTQQHQQAMDGNPMLAPVRNMVSDHNPHNSYMNTFPMTHQHQHTIDGNTAVNGNTATTSILNASHVNGDRNPHDYPRVQWAQQQQHHHHHQQQQQQQQQCQQQRQHHTIINV